MDIDQQALALAKQNETYAVMYTDNTYITLDLPLGDYNKIAMSMLGGLSCVIVEAGVFSLTDVRSIILQRKQVKPENEGANPALSVEDSQWISRQFTQEDER